MALLQHSQGHTKFGYPLRSGYEEGSAGGILRHHPDTVVAQAWNYTSLNKITGMTDAEATIHRWNLTKTMLIQEGIDGVRQELAVVLARSNSNLASMPPSILYRGNPHG